VSPLSFIRGNLLVSGQSAQWLEVLDPASGERRPPKWDIAGIFSRICSSRDGGLLAFGTATSVEIWDPLRTERIGQPMTHESGVRSMRFSPDSKWLATASGDRTARLWNLQFGPSFPSVPLQHEGNVHDLDFSSDSRLLATASDDGLRLWTIPSPPASLREMELRTWLKVGARRKGEGAHEVNPWEERQKFREELKQLEERRTAASR